MCCLMKKEHKELEREIETIPDIRHLQRELILLTFLWPNQIYYPILSLLITFSDLTVFDKCYFLAPG